MVPCTASPPGGMGPWWDEQGVTASRLTVHMNAVRRDIDVQEGIWKKEGLMASSSPYIEKAFFFFFCREMIIAEVA